MSTLSSKNQNTNQKTTTHTSELQTNNRPILRGRLRGQKAKFIEENLLALESQFVQYQTDLLQHNICAALQNMLTKIFALEQMDLESSQAYPDIFPIRSIAQSGLALCLETNDNNVQSCKEVTQ